MKLTFAKRSPHRGIDSEIAFPAPHSLVPLPATCHSGRRIQASRVPGIHPAYHRTTWHQLSRWLLYAGEGFYFVWLPKTDLGLKGGRQGALPIASRCLGKERVPHPWSFAGSVFPPVFTWLTACLLPALCHSRVTVSVRPSVTTLSKITNLPLHPSSLLHFLSTHDHIFY